MPRPSRRQLFLLCRTPHEIASYWPTCSRDYHFIQVLRHIGRSILELDYEHPNSPQCDGPTRRRSYNESMNALSSILPGIPHVRVLKLLARPDLVSWNLFPPDTQSALSSLILQDSVVSLLLSGISHLPVPLLVSILQLRNLTSLNWSHISHNPADLIPFQALRVSSLNNIRNLCLSGQAIFGAESLSELTNVASLVLRASVAKIEHFTCYNWYCHTSEFDILSVFST